MINRKYLFKRLGWPLKGPLGFLSPKKDCFGLYCGPWYLQKGHLPLVAGLASRLSTQKQHAGRCRHCRHTNAECIPLSKQRGHLNHKSSVSMAHAGIRIGWFTGGLVVLTLAGVDVAGSIAG